jgi:hypothetical protein
MLLIQLDFFVKKMTEFYSIYNKNLIKRLAEKFFILRKNKGINRKELTINNC